MNEIIGEQIERTIMSLYLKITVPPWAAPCLRLQARGTARARPVKVSNSEGTPRHAQGSLTIGTGPPSHMTGGPGRACAWAGQANGTDEARPGQSLRQRLLFTRELQGGNLILRTSTHDLQSRIWSGSHQLSQHNP